MAVKLTRLTHEIAIQLHLVAECCTIYGSRSRRPVRKLLDTPSYGFCQVTNYDTGDYGDLNKTLVSFVLTEVT
jgi:hypothetical protein